MGSLLVTEDTEANELSLLATKVLSKFVHLSFWRKSRTKGEKTDHICGVKILESLEFHTPLSNTNQWKIHVNWQKLVHIQGLENFSTHYQSVVTIIKWLPKLHVNFFFSSSGSLWEFLLHEVLATQRKI